MSSAIHEASGPFNGESLRSSAHSAASVEAFWPIATFRAQGRILGLDAYSKLGGLQISNHVEPPITHQLFELLLVQPVMAMLVLDLGHSLAQIVSASEGGGERQWKLRLVPPEFLQSSFAQESHSEPHWVIVPMSDSPFVRTGIPKSRSMKELQKSASLGGLKLELPNPRHLALGVILHERVTGELLSLNTYTNQRHVTFESDRNNLNCQYHIWVADRTNIGIDSGAHGSYSIAPLAVPNER